MALNTTRLKCKLQCRQARGVTVEFFGAGDVQRVKTDNKCMHPRCSVIGVEFVGALGEMLLTQKHMPRLASSSAATNCCTQAW